MNDPDALDLWAFDAPVEFAIKSIDDDGRFEGLAVPFGDHDLSKKRDIFDASTDFGRALKSGADILYYHGLPTVHSEPNPFTDAILGDAEFKTTEEGLWMTGQITLRDKYVESVKALVRSGKLGLSTGTAAHRVRRSANPDGTSHTIKTWPIVEVSLTPTPAHPRTSVYALKTLLDGEGDESAADAPPDSPSSAPGESSPAGFVDSLRRAESALDWACRQRDLNGVKAEAIKTLAETVKRFNATRIDPEKLAAGKLQLTRLLTRL
jgi:HK97 family phage prohead protease